jgi:TatD DNase family protein
MSGFCDAHCHLQDPRFRDEIDGIVSACRAREIERVVVNGTRESDWESVAALARRFPGWVIPSYGLHPWWSRERSSDWRIDLEARLAADPGAHLGETGLDRWMKDPDPADQEEVLRIHLDLAVRYDRALSLHCLRAWGALLDLLRSHPLPSRGFLLHSYGGPSEMVPEFVALGARFSFPGAFLASDRARKRLPFEVIPPDRLLIETDAPDQLLPAELDEFHLTDPATGHRLNHPGNLPTIYRHAPKIPGLEQIAANFERLFGPAGG